jgi:hypothetical protein
LGLIAYSALVEQLSVTPSRNVPSGQYQYCLPTMNPSGLINKSSPSGQGDFYEH